MPRILRSIFVFAAAAVACSYAADDLQSIYSKIDSAAASFKGLSADIRQDAHMDQINEDDVSTGKILVKRPKAHDVRMRIDFQEPNQKQVAFAGNKVEIYYPKTNTVEEYDLGKRKGMVEQFLILGFGSTSQELQSAYRVRLVGEEAINGQPTTRLELIPKSSDMAQTFPKIELWISNATGLALQQKLYDKGGRDYHLATYSNMKMRPDISDSEIKLNIPKDAHISKQPIR